MIDQKSELALAFLHAQPSAAASVLEQQPLQQVAAFLEDVPYKPAATVLKKMLPIYTARLLRYLKPATAAAFLSEMNINHVTAILRHAPIDISASILALLPERISLACNLLLSFPESAVGAWMLTHFFLLPEECDIGEAVERVSAAENAGLLATVYAVNRNRELVGSVALSTLMRSSTTKLLSSIIKKNPEFVFAWSSLAWVSQLDVWQRKESVAVVNKDHQLIGVLRHLDLRNGLSETASVIKKSRGDDPVSGILEVYGTCLLALFSSVGEAANIGDSREISHD